MPPTNYSIENSLENGLAALVLARCGQTVGASTDPLLDPAYRVKEVTGGTPVLEGDVGAGPLIRLFSEEYIQFEQEIGGGVDNSYSIFDYTVHIQGISDLYRTASEAKTAIRELSNSVRRMMTNLARNNGMATLIGGDNGIHTLESIAMIKPGGTAKIGLTRSGDGNPPKFAAWFDQTWVLVSEAQIKS